MPIRRHHNPPGSVRRPTDRRKRVALVLAGAIALSGVAAIIGRDTSSSSTNSASTSATTGRSTDRSDSAPGDGAEAAPATTIIPGAAPAGADVAFDADDDATAPTATAATRGTEVGAPLGPKVVRTGSIEVEVGRHRFTEASSRLQAIATGAGGFVSASETSSLDGDPRGSITVRIPAASFDGVLARIAKLGAVQSSTTGSQDVTGEYSDVAARIRALESEREQIGLVLGRAETITDILSVRDRLSVVQGELEQLQGRQQVLDDQTSLSTITVALSEKGAAPIGIDQPAERRGLAKVWHDSIDRIADGGQAIALGFAAMLPWLLLALVLWLPARTLWRRLAPPAVANGALAPAPPAATTTD